MKKATFTAYLESKGFAKRTQKCYIKSVEWFLNKTGKEDTQVTKPDVLNFLEYLKSRKGYQNAARKNCLTALNHYFTFLFQNEQITSNPCAFLKIKGKRPKKMYQTYTTEELDQLFDNYYQLFVRNCDDHRNRHDVLYRERNALLLSILIYQGATTSEIEKIELSDIDLIKATIRLRGGKQIKDRTLPLKATQIGLLIHYLQNIRPKLAELYTAQSETENEKLFFSQSIKRQNKPTGDALRYAFLTLAKQLKSIDKRFLNVVQLRTSVITNWLKTNNLRKTQYLAGHKYVSSTEKYQPNNLDSLIDDINKLHPF